MENDIVRMLFLRRQRQKKRWKIKTISGSPPLSFKAKAGALKNYKIYGNTVDGESVGNRTGNLCENSISGVNISSNGFIYADIHNDVGYAKVVAGETYTINSYVYAFFEEEPKEGNRSYDNGRVVGTSPSTFEAPINGYVAFRTESGSQLQCNEGNNLLPYEPYGYKVPVTVSNGTDTQTIPIYLPEQIRKVGDEAEYISYDDQKLHRIGAEDIDVTLPELPTLTGTNVLTVGTVVQPSDVYIKGRIKKGE